LFTLLTNNVLQITDKMGDDINTQNKLAWWYIPIIPVTGEAERGEFRVGREPKVNNTLSQKQKQKKNPKKLGHGSGGRALAYHGKALGEKFKI
jgi:hypothetical protein